MNRHTASGAKQKQARRPPDSERRSSQGIGSRALPDSVKAEMHRRMAEPGSADDD